MIDIRILINKTVKYSIKAVNDLDDALPIYQAWHSSAVFHISTCMDRCCHDNNKFTDIKYPL